LKPIKPNTNKLCNGKKYEKNDTTYSSLWLYKKDKTILPSDMQDKIVSIHKTIFSEFNPTLAKNIISYWSNENNIILDPFAGRSRGFVAGLMNRKYYGFEIDNEIYDYLNELHESDSQLYEVPTFINDDSFNIDNIKYNELPRVDLIFTCPPYWCLEKYKQVPGELSNYKSYDLFLERLKQILFKSLTKLKRGGYLAIVIGDFRLNGKYIMLHSDILQFFKYQDVVELHDIIAVQNIPFNIAAVYFGNMKKHKKVAKVHEYLLIFKKK
jgi:DNA modification methylase